MAVWTESQNVLKALHTSMSLENCKMWVSWNADLMKLLLKTAKYSDTTLEFDSQLKENWEKLAGESLLTWNKIVKGNWVAAEPLDELEIVEQEMLFGEEDEDNWGEVAEVVLDIGMMEENED